MRRVLLVGAIVVTTIACVGPFSEMVENNYPNAAAARAGAGGFLPDILTADATDIREVHDIDTNETWGCFKTANPSLALAAATRLNAQPFTGSLSERPAEMFRDFSWWPDSMTRPRQGLLEWREATGFRVRLAADEDADLVCFHRDGH